MKKSLSIVAALVVAASAYGQGQVFFQNNINGTIRAAVYGPETADSSVAIHGNTSDAAYSFPLGSTVYTGARLNGSTYSAQLFGGASSVTDSTLLSSCTTSDGTTPLILVFRTASNAGFISPLSGATAYVPGVAEGANAKLQMRAWFNGGGTFPTYASAVAATPGVGQFGSSTLFTLGTKGPPDAPAPLVGLESFNIHTTVPEPSTIALGVIGAAAFLVRRRKQQ